MTATTNRIDQLFAEKKNLLNVYFTAGFPQLDSTLPILQALQQAGADLIEIGMPYSDPLADGPVIQASNMQALHNGMKIKVLFDQLRQVRQQGIHLPLILMGYLNPVLQYGLERFLADCAACGIDGVILPDMPFAEYEEEYQPLFERYAIHPIFLITPQTSEARVLDIDRLSKGFIYVVSTDSTTGTKSGTAEGQEIYFERIARMPLRNPRLIGFGISDHASFAKACQYAQGAIIGSAFIRLLAQSKDLRTDIHQFVQKIKGY